MLRIQYDSSPEQPSNHELFDFMSQISQEMASEYKRIQKLVREDPGTAGDQGEENWAELLKDWLPSIYHIVTKGRILGHSGKASPQIDILVLKPSYPQKLLNKKVYLAAGVAAAFECKTTLQSRHIHEGMKTCRSISCLFTPRKGTPYKELNQPIIYGLLAHSHEWKKENSTPVKNTEDKIYEEDKNIVLHPRHMIDILCVADTGTWVAQKTSCLISTERLGSLVPSTVSGKTIAAFSAYIGCNSTFPNQDKSYEPIGTLIFSLFYKLSWDDKYCRSLAEYYQEAKLGGSGHGKTRDWKPFIFSDELKEKLERNLVGKERNIFPSDDQWNEWDMWVIPE